MNKIRLFKNFTGVFLLGAILCAGLFSCEEYPNAYRHTDGVPEVLYVRLPDAAKADSLLDGAFLGSTICIVGNNLRSVRELFFNDQQAILNTSLITDHTLIVTVPNGIPVDVTNKMYLTAFNDQTVSFDFKTNVPGPSVNSISCEYALEGGEASLYGDFFLDDPNIPLKILFPGNLPVTEILSIEKNRIRFIVPQGASKGYINVNTLYGTGRSKFQYKDDRGMILDWDVLKGAGWRDGNNRLFTEGGISGKYIRFKGSLSGWPEDDFSFNLWSVWTDRPKPPSGDFFDATKLNDLLFKFEVNVLEPWTKDAMQIVFHSWETAGTNGYYSDGSYPRALWIPWRDSKSYMTDGWVTITIPMKDFRFSAGGAVLEPKGPGNYGGLSMFIWNSGGVQGSASCTTELWLDNIRVVPVDK